MILVQRSVSVAPGMLSAAMAFANEISTQVKATTGTDLKIAVPVGGNAARMAWIADYENLAQYEASWRSKIPGADQEGGGHLCARWQRLFDDPIPLPRGRQL